MTKREKIAAKWLGGSYAAGRLLTNADHGYDARQMLRELDSCPIETTETVVQMVKRTLRGRGPKPKRKEKR